MGNDNGALPPVLQHNLAGFGQFFPGATGANLLVDNSSGYAAGNEGLTGSGTFGSGVKIADAASCYYCRRIPFYLTILL
jgi:hypothetical protein